MWTSRLILGHYLVIVGNGVEVTILGQRHLKLLEHEEIYEISKIAYLLLPNIRQRVGWQYHSALYQIRARGFHKL